MKNNKLLLSFLLFLTLAYIVSKISFITHAQQQNDEQIPSDLSLDLDLAEKNPAPAQKLLQDAQTEKAQITTSSGEKVDIPVKENVPQEIKTQSTQAAENPQQTTSEQVVNNTFIEEGSNQPQSSTAPSDNTNTIPGTNILEPDDNAVPSAPNASANPTTSSPESSPNSSPAADNSPTPNDTNSPGGTPSNPETNSYTTPINSSDNTQPANGTTIPLENGATTPPANPPPPSSDNSGSSSNQTASSDSSSGDSTAVQGVSTGPTLSLWRQLRSKVSKLLGG